MFFSKGKTGQEKCPKMLVGASQFFASKAFYGLSFMFCHIAFSVLIL